ISPCLAVGEVRAGEGVEGVVEQSVMLPLLTPHDTREDGAPPAAVVPPREYRMLAGIGRRRGRGGTQTHAHVAGSCSGSGARPRPPTRGFRSARARSGRRGTRGVRRPSGARPPASPATSPRT